MNEYEKKDEKGRDIFKTLCTQQQWCKHHKDAKDKYAHWDLSYFSGKTSMIGEIKYRSEYEGTSFPDWILQVDKLQALQDIYQKMLSKGQSTRVTYINHFNDNYTLIWDLTYLKLEDYTIKKLWLPKNDFDSELVLKDVIFLPSYQAIFQGETDLDKSIFKGMTNDEDEDELPF